MKRVNLEGLLNKEGYIYRKNKASEFVAKLHRPDDLFPISEKCILCGEGYPLIVFLRKGSVYPVYTLSGELALCIECAKKVLKALHNLPSETKKELQMRTEEKYEKLIYKLKRIYKKFEEEMEDVHIGDVRKKAIESILEDGCRYLTYGRVDRRIQYILRSFRTIIANFFGLYPVIYEKQKKKSPDLISIVFDVKTSRIVLRGRPRKAYILTVEILCNEELIYRKKYKYYSGSNYKLLPVEVHRKIYKTGIWMKNIKKEDCLALRIAAKCAELVDLMLDKHPYRKNIISEIIINKKPLYINLVVNPSFITFEYGGKDEDKKT